MMPTRSPELEPAAQGEPLLRIRGVSKSFFGVSVLRAIDLDLVPGEVHALVGENGAGKSTLMKIIAGVHRADQGTIELDGHPITFGSPIDAQRAGVSTIFQEFNLLPERSVAENVFLGREPRRAGFVDRVEMRRRTDELFADLSITSVSAGARVGTLSVAEQQIVEIAKAVSYDARVIAMDEPTAALAEHEVELLYRLVARLKARGVAVVYVSHRLEETFDLCDRITVLKDGDLVLTTEVAQITPDELVRTMVGRDFAGYFPPKDPGHRLGDVVLELEGVGNAQVDDVHLTVRAGEVVGLAGLQGSGRTEIAYGTFGIAPFTRGSIRVASRPVRVRSPRQAVRHGIALVTEDRKAQGLALQQSVMANARLVLDAVLPATSEKRSTAIPGLLSSLELVAPSNRTEVRYLSGGNQQKVVLAKWLVTDPRVIVLDEPTRGLDVGAKRNVYDAIRRLAAQGVAILLISSELPEILAMSDRLLVLREGRVVGELPGGSTEEAVMGLAIGAAHPGLPDAGPTAGVST